MPTYNPADQFIFTADAVFVLDGAADALSFKFTAQATKTCTGARIRGIDSFGTSPTYRIGIQGDAGGLPDGSFIAQVDSQLADSWNILTFDASVALSKNTAYHLVVEYNAGTIDGSNFVKIHYFTPNNQMIPVNQKVDTNQAVYTDTGGGFSIVANSNPIYLLSYSDGTSEGNPYWAETSTVVHNRQWPKVIYQSLTENGVVDQVGFHIKKTGAGNPVDDVYYSIENDNGDVLRSGTLVTKTDITTSFAWHDATLASPLTLEAGIRYHIILTSPKTTTDTVWYITNGIATTTASFAGEDTYELYTYGGKLIRMANKKSGANWVEFNNRDLNFRMRREIIGSTIITDPQKKYFYKVYDSAGSYITNWDSDVVGPSPVFTRTINGGMSNLKIRLNRNIDDFGETVDVAFNNEVRVYVKDKETSAQIIYSGYIAEYKPTIDQNGRFVDITLYPYSAQFTRYILRAANGDTSVAHASEEPGAILRDTLDKYAADGGKITYNSTDIENTGNTVTYTFNTQMVWEAIEKCRQFAPNGWYWYVNPENKVIFRGKSGDYQHLFRVGGNIASIQIEKRVENVINRVYFTGGDDASNLGTVLYRVYNRAGSISTYGLYGMRMTDRRVTLQATSKLMADHVLDAQEAPESRFKIKVLDSNGTEEGFDIETINPGDTCKILNFARKSNTLWDAFTWDVDVWDYSITDVAATVLQIVNLEYHADFIILELSTRLPSVTHRIEDINRNMSSDMSRSNPAAPS